MGFSKTNQSKIKLGIFFTCTLLCGVLSLQIFYETTNPGMIREGTYWSSLTLISCSIVSVVLFFDLLKNSKTSQSYSEVKNEKSEIKKNLESVHAALNRTEPILITNYRGDILHVNKKFEEFLKYSNGDLVGKNYTLFSSEYHQPEFYKQIWEIISKGFIWEGEIQNKAKDGSYRWTITTIIPIVGRIKSENKFIVKKTNLTRQKEIEKTLEDTLKKLKREEKLKGEFASMISHELKSPLTPIRGYCDMLLEENFLGELNVQQKDSLKIILNNAIRLEKLIEDVLDIQKIDLNRMPFIRKEMDIVNFCNQVKNDSLVLMRDKNIEFIVNMDGEGKLFSDSVRLRQVIDNLIKNSVDFVPKGGKIWFGYKKDEEEFVFYVKDNGVGISPENQKNLFKKFFQGDTSHTRKHGGTGLGLAIAKGILEGLNGKIWVSSTEDLGTVFYFTIPVIKKENQLNGILELNRSAKAK